MNPFFANYSNQIIETILKRAHLTAKVHHTSKLSHPLLWMLPWPLTRKTWMKWTPYNVR